MYATVLFDLDHMLLDSDESERLAFAATMAGAGAMKTGLEAMRLGGVIYVAPFFFVLNPALVGEAPAWEVMLTLSTALLGIWFLSCGLQGHFSLIGSFPDGAAGMALRLLLVVGGLCIAAPGGDWIGLSHWALVGVGVVLAAPAILVAATRRNMAASP